MNAARLALFASLLSAVASLGCNTTDVDEPENAAPAQAAVQTGYDYEFITDRVAAMPPPAAPRPAEVAGRLAPELIGDVVHAASASFAACSTNGAADVTVRFKIDEAGLPSDVHATKAGDAALGRCAESAVAALRFPKSHGGPAEVIYPLVF